MGQTRASRWRHHLGREFRAGYARLAGIRTTRSPPTSCRRLRASSPSHLVLGQARLPEHGTEASISILHPSRLLPPPSASLVSRSLPQRIRCAYPKCVQRAQHVGRHVRLDLLLLQLLLRHLPSFRAFPYWIVTLSRNSPPPDLLGEVLFANSSPPRQSPCAAHMPLHGCVL